MNIYLKKSIKWFENSNVANKKDPYDLSFNNGYNWKKQSYDFIYHEITGYSISMYCYLFHKTRNKTYLKKAKDTAAYLLKVQSQRKDKTNGGFFHSINLKNHKPNNYYYTFDNFIIIQGLLDLYRITKQQKLLSASIKCASWIIKEMQHPDNDGSLLSRMNADNFHKAYISNKFPGDKGVLHGKIAISFLKLWQITGDKKYKEFAENCLNYCLRLQREDGAFWANNHKYYVFSHAQCYVTEGLLYAAHIMKKRKYIVAIKKSLDYLHNNLRGGLPYSFDDKVFLKRIFQKFFPIYTSDATSQFLRLVLGYSEVLKNNDLLKEYSLKNVGEFLLKMQFVGTNNPELEGSFMHKYTNIFGIKLLSPINSTWCTQFSIQALHELELEKSYQFVEHLY